MILICSNQEGFFSGLSFLVILNWLYDVSLMGKHRSRLKILEDILSVINGNKGVRKTQIMYRAYLSYRLLNRYLHDVMEAGLVKCNAGNCYSLTKKGEIFLAEFDNYKRYLRSVEENLIKIEAKRAVLAKMCPNNCDATADSSASEAE